MELLGASTKQNVGGNGGSILSCCPHNPHRHEWALKKVMFNIVWRFQSRQLIQMEMRKSHWGCDKTIKS